MRVEIDEGQRQMILLALGRLASERPGFQWALNEIAVKMDNVKDGKAELFEKFIQLRNEEPKRGQ